METLLTPSAAPDLNNPEAQNTLRRDRWLFGSARNSRARLYPIMATPPTLSRNVATQIATGVVWNHARTDLFAYLSGAWYAGTGAFPFNQVRFAAGVTSLNGYVSPAVEFMTDADDFEIIVREAAGSGYRLWIDGELNALNQALLNTSAGTYPIWHRVQLAGGRAARHVRIEFAYLAGGFAGIKTAGADSSIWPVVSARRPRAIVFGDSYVEGATTSTANGGEHRAFAHVLGRVFDWEVTNSGSGGTGYLANGGAGKYTYQDRIAADLIAYAPDVVVLEGGRNDGSPTQAVIQAAADLLLSTIQAGLPNARIYVVGPLYDNNTAIPASLLTIRAGISAACTARVVHFIDNLVPGKEWITGSRPGGTGNAPRLVAADNVHYTPEGHEFVAHRIASEILRLEGYAAQDAA